MGDFVGVFSNYQPSFGFIVGIVQRGLVPMSPYYVVEFLGGFRLRVLEETVFAAICSFVGPVVVPI